MNSSSADDADLQILFGRNESYDKGEVITPVTLSRAETILHLVMVSQGIPINLIIGVVIVRNRRLHNPRNAFWLGIIALNLMTIFQAVLRLLVVHVEVRSDEKDQGVICMFFSFLTGKPYTILLFILLLATLDRYVAITYPLFHRKHITVRVVVIIQVFCFFLVFGLLSLPFVLRWVPLRCGFNLRLGKWNMLVRSILVALCIAAQIKVYLQTRRYLRQHHEALLRQQQTSNDNHLDGAAIPMRVLANKNNSNNTTTHLNNDLVGGAAMLASSSLSDAHQAQQMSVNHDSATCSSAKNTTFFVHRRNKTISKLELEASLTLIVGIVSLFIVTAPMFIVYFAVAVCQHFEGDCRRLTDSVPYVRQTALIHAVYGPLIYMIRSREFSLAVRQMLRAQSSRLSANFV